MKLSSHPSVLQEDQLDQLSLYLSALKASAASDLARKHKIATNPSKRSKGAVAAEPVKIQPKTRINIFL